MGGKILGAARHLSYERKSRCAWPMINRYRLIGHYSVIIQSEIIDRTSSIKRNLNLPKSGLTSLGLTVRM